MKTKKTKTNRTEIKDLTEGEQELTLEEAKKVKGGTGAAASGKLSGTAINKVKSSDKQQTAVLDFIKG